MKSASAMSLDVGLNGKPIDLTIVVPCFNERENIALLVERIGKALGSVEWELVFVDDDSPDGTAECVRTLAQSNRRVRCIQRIGRRGLSTAVIEGFLSSSAPYLAVIDGDLQHDETLLPAMLQSLKSQPLDVVVGSRYLDGGGLGNWSNGRASISKFAARLSRLVVKEPLTDPMSGFVMLTRLAFQSAVRRLSGQGFKILLDLFASAPTPLRFKELPYIFKSRLHGESKLDSLVIWEYLMLLIDKRIGWLIPPRFFLFALVGVTGVFVHLAVLAGALNFAGFAVSQAIATLAAMTGNFLINNVLTYRDRRLRGTGLVIGLLSFYAVCAIGAAANIGIASAIFETQYTWWVSGIAGSLVGVVWNYAVSSVFTWRQVVK
jgi:dolichol-phosphate mannosyltransferase